MMRERWIAGLAVLACLGSGLPVAADEVTGSEDMQEQMWLMQQKMKRMEDQLAETQRQLERAQTQVPAGPAEKGECWICSITMGGWVAGSYFYNFENPDGRDLGAFNTGIPGAQPFHPDANSFSLDQVWFEMEKAVSEEDRAGFRLDFVIGKTADILNNGFLGQDGFSGSDQDFHLYQGYVQYLAPIGPGVHFKFGKFATLIGSEVAQAPYNLNITRGHVYNLFQPITHTGILGTVAPWEGGSVSLGFVDETRAFPARDVDINNNKALLWQIAHVFSDQFSASFNGTFGDSDSGQLTDTPAGDHETILDAILNFTPNEKFKAYINADYINSENSIFGNTDTEGYGIAVAGRYALTEKMGFALRTEWVDLRANLDPSELQIWGLTGTLDYSLTSNLLVRGELRYDRAEGDLDDIFFDSGSSTRGILGSGQQLTEDDQVTAGVEVIYTF